MRFWMFPPPPAVSNSFCNCPCICKKPLKDDVMTWRVEHWRGRELLESELKVCPACYRDLTSEPWSLLEA